MQAICSDWTKDKLSEMAALPRVSLASLAVFVFVVLGLLPNLPLPAPGSAAPRYRVVPMVANSLSEKKKEHRRRKINIFSSLCLQSGHIDSLFSWEDIRQLHPGL